MAWSIPTSYWKWALLGGVWVAAAAHTGWSMRRYNRRGWVWFLISLFATPVPAAVVSYWEYFRQLRRSRRPEASPSPRCPHCGCLLAGRQIRRVGGKGACPECNMVLDDERYA